ncbi:hypothetical protein GCM10007209_30500 [Haloferax sulfurifontis]|uniref:Uncharacterized protein n=2 Tax=Haloferax sulfurifontis TaxID=255616 RepID=A0A830E0R0_9EURY|nr:hypothetical protein GCM10007209_30500 [Haloferax sulfurifontis]
MARVRFRIDRSVTTVLFVTTDRVVDMETSRLTPRQSWLFVVLSGIVAAGVVYVFGPADAGVPASVAVGGVVSLMFAVGYAVSNERVKQVLLDLLSLLP